MKSMRAIITLLLFWSGCSFHPPENKVLRIKGSDTMFMLTEQLANEFMNDNPGFLVHNEGGGSQLGIRALIKGEVDLCATSRTLKSDEIKKLAENYNLVGISHLIAKDALSIYVNEGNTIRNLELHQIKKIFSGRVTYWSEVGGNNEKIDVIIRSPNSGTHYYFYEHILEEENYATSATVKNLTEEIIEEVRKNKNAIGYGGIGFSKEVPHILINGIEPNIENVKNDSYPIIRYLYFYTQNNPDGLTKKFLDWVNSREGQKIIRNSGYIPLWDFD